MIIIILFILLLNPYYKNKKKIIIILYIKLLKKDGNLEVATHLRIGDLISHYNKKTYKFIQLNTTKNFYFYKPKNYLFIWKGSV